MKLRFVPVLLLCPLLASLNALPSAAGAAPRLEAFVPPSTSQPLLLRTGSGCGWDYPCPPEPTFGRQGYRPGQVTIHNNYGPVNVYSGISRHPGRPVSIDPGFCQDDGCRYGCGGYPCTEECGPLCWMRRFRQGYCGHGCQSYLEQSRTEAEEKAAWQEEEAWKRHKEEWMYEKRADCAPPNCVPDYDAPPPPPPAAYYYGRPPERDYAPPQQQPRRDQPRPDLTPRERFEGPKYPAR